ncbi:MAG: hypothetical protein ACLPTF_00835 [Steroidobacteraceae bacterium]
MRVDATAQLLRSIHLPALALQAFKKEGTPGELEERMASGNVGFGGASLLIRGSYVYGA